MGESASRFGVRARRTISDPVPQRDHRRQEVASATELEGDLIECFDIPLDSVDLGEVRAQHGINEPGHEGTGVELPESALILELILEILDCGEGAVVDRQDEVATDEHIELPAAHVLGLALERDERDQDSVGKSDQMRPAAVRAELTD